MRGSLVALVLAALVAAPVGLLLAQGLGPGALLGAVVGGFWLGIESVGWVFLPQLLLAIAVASLALQQLATRAAGQGRAPVPGWIDPAVESALLLGMLGTIHGMVQGFTGLSPEELEPGPLVHALGRALRSSLFGFAIALVGVWAKVRPESEVQLAREEGVPREGQPA